MMELLLFRSLWTNGFDLEAALEDCESGVFDGVEGPAPDDSRRRGDFASALRDAGVPFIAEITTGGGGVPDPGISFERHLEEFRRKIEEARDCSPLFVTAIAGSDAWPLAQSADFLGSAMAIAAASGIPVSFETHRSRPTFHPWATRDLLRQLPEMQLTCDFSHWCCVCERLVLDSEPDLLALCASRTRHVHARVGYAQGPQAPHPAAPEHREALLAHERWWNAIWEAQELHRTFLCTMTPEFGPDGYLHTLPFTDAPAADLDQINCWMAERQRKRFASRQLAA